MKGDRTGDCSRLRSFFDLSRDMLVTAGFDGYFKLVNPACTEILGYSPEVLTSRPFLDFVHPDDRHSTVAESQSLASGTPTISFENRYRCRDGAYRWLHWTATPLPETGEIVAVARDVSEWRERQEEVGRLNAELEVRVEERTRELEMANQELAESRRVLETLVRNLPGIAYRCRTDGEWTMEIVSDGCRAVTGYDPSDLVGNRTVSFEDLIHTDDRLRVRQSVRDALDSKSSFELEYRIRHASGEERWVWDRGSGVYGRDGEFRYLEGLIIDVTRRERAEDQARNQARWLNEANDAISVRDLEGRIIYWNQGAAELYGWTSEDVLGRHADELIFRPDNTTPLQQAMDHVMRRGVWEGELTQITRDGKDVVVEARWTLIRDEHGQPESILGVTRDITEKKTLESHLLRAQRLESVGSLASGIAHDLNNALSPILMSLQLLQRRSNGQQDRALQILESSAKRASNLVKQILTFGRGMPGDHVPVQIRHSIREVQRVSSQTFPKGIRFSVQLDQDLWPVSADATQMEQVLMNLFVNARDAMPEGGTIALRAKNVRLDHTYCRLNTKATPGPYVQIDVSDTGAGMPPDVLERIFEPFFTTKGVGKGTGLGLSTLLKIVEDHHGFVHTYSEVGRGTSFKIYLPALPSSSVAGCEEAAHFLSGRGTRILVVDDEVSVREMAAMVLENHEYTVATAKNGADGIANYLQKPADVVIVDWRMPVMDGPATVAALRSVNPDVRVVISSGLEHEVRLEDLDAGPEIPFLQKPYTAEALLAVIARVFDTEQPQQRESA